VARCSGDAFGVLLPETEGHDAATLAERLRATVQERLALRDHLSEQQVDVTVSVGVLAAASVDAAMTAEQLMQEAEAAVRRAKEGGRNRVEHVTVRSTAPPRTAPSASLRPPGQPA
jgi:two-component system cell cycle response regulator